MKVNIYEARTKFSNLIARAEAGEEIIIARAGRAVVRMVPIASPTVRQAGTWAGEISMSDDFDEELPEGTFSTLEP